MLNDYVLKVYHPSWITGKLSDFAGLFFFPFIVVAVLSLLFFKLNLTSRSIGQFAFAFVVIWFVLIKLFLPINLLTTEFASLFINGTAQILLDPTDLVALIIIFPAWKLWNQPQQQKPSRISYVALSIGMLAVMATSPPAQQVCKVTNLEYYKDGIVYAADRDGWGEDGYPVAQSMDAGQTWEVAAQEGNIEEKGLPIKHCSHLNPEICYRLTRFGQLQELKISKEQESWVNVSGLEPARAYDLILFEWNDKEYVIVAVGEHGVWRRELPNGSWDEISVMGADK